MPPDAAEQTRVKRILVLCTGNSCRSQMAEGYLRRFAGQRAEVFSAGVEAHGVNPLAVAVMKEDGTDISSQTSKQVDQFLGQPFDYLITVCDNARERCPYFPSSAQRFHHEFPDPAKAQGDAEEVMQQFRAVRDQIRDYCLEFTNRHL